MAGSEPSGFKCKTYLLKPPLPPLETAAFTLTLQLSAASTKSYIKAIYWLLFHYLSYLKPANWRETGLNIKLAVNSRKPSQQAERDSQQAERDSRGKMALGIKKGRNHNVVTLLYLLLIYLLRGKSRTE